MAAYSGTICQKHAACDSQAIACLPQLVLGALPTVCCRGGGLLREGVTAQRRQGPRAALHNTRNDNVCARTAVSYHALSGVDFLSRRDMVWVDCGAGRRSLRKHAQRQKNTLLRRCCVDWWCLWQFYPFFFSLFILSCPSSSIILSFPYSPGAPMSSSERRQRRQTDRSKPALCAFFLQT